MASHLLESPIRAFPGVSFARSIKGNPPRTARRVFGRSVMMEHDPLYWQTELLLRWEEGKALADMLLSSDVRIPPDGMFGDALRRSVPPDVATEAIRRLTAVFHQQVEHVAHLLDAACCALYLVESPPSVSDARQRGRKDGRPLGHPSLSLRALYGASWGQDSTRLGVPATYGGPAMQALVQQTAVPSDIADPPLLHEWAQIQQVRHWLYMSEERL